jgi:citronellol/citronellal dehydrogenase
MTRLAEGLAGEVGEFGIAVNALWPATIVESQASINHGLSAPENWRKASVVSDALLALLAQPASEANGRVLTDEEVLREAGVTDFDRYNCVPGGDPVYICGPNAKWPLGGT